MDKEREPEIVKERKNSKKLPLILGIIISLIVSVILFAYILGLEIEEKSNEFEKEYIQVSTDKEVYRQGENVTIYLKNISNVTLNQSVLWNEYIIKNSEGDIVFHQGKVSPAGSSISPGEEVTVGRWEQKDINDDQIAPGLYIVEKGYAGYTDTAEFRIH